MSENMDDLIRFVEGMAKAVPPGVGDGKVTAVKSVSYKDGGAIIVLDRIEPDFTPDYCTHGRATCVTCDEWVWLGHLTHRVVADEEAMPMCRQCAETHVKDGAQYMGHVEDHRREDGPHE